MTQIRNDSHCRWLLSIALVAVVLGLAGCGAEPRRAPPPPPPPVPFQPQLVVVELGAHGGKTTLVSTEAGGWTRNGDPVTGGAVVKGENGAEYTLTLANGQWSAEFLPPDPVIVGLGTSGDSTMLQQLEDGTFERNGVPLASGDIRTAENGNRYRFNLSPSGTWTARFVPPDPIVIRLGASNNAVRIHVLENDQYELEGEPIASGQTWTAANGNMYRFERAEDGGWTASFVSAPPVSVTLGISGDRVSIEQLEDGGFQVEGRRLVSGAVVTALNGNRYRLVFGRDRMWRAEFVPPSPAAVALGRSGSTALVRSLEDGSYELDGEALTSGEIRVAANGNRYRFMLQADGEWTAEFLPPPPAVVSLGASGDTVEIESGENRIYVLGGELLISGQIRTVENGNRYRFVLGADGTWTATFVPISVSVRLGAHGGTVTLTRLEDGTHQLGETVFRSGDTVTAPNDHRYRLTLVEGRWLVEPLPTIISISLPGSAGTIVVSRFENGSYFYEGSAIRSGDTVSVRGVTYVLTLAGNRGTAVRRGITRPDPTPPVPPPPVDDDTTFDTLDTYVGARPRLQHADGTGSRAGTVLEVGDRRYLIADLFSVGGSAVDRTFAESARDRISELLGRMEVLLGLYEGGLDIEDDIEDRWDEIRNELEALFPGHGRRLLEDDIPKKRGGRTIDVEDTVDDIEDVLAALSSEDAFEDALDRGILNDTGIDNDEIDEIFSASRSIERLGFGWTPNTRFGAYSRRGRRNVNRSLAFLAGEEGLGAFAYSPLDRARTADLPSRGEGLYAGETIVASGQNDQRIYRGVFELSVRFSSREVAGLVTRLQDSSGDPWTYDAADVEAIVLPTSRLDSNDGSFESSSGSRGHITFSSFLGGRRSVTLSGNLEGRFLETGTREAEAAIGTWELRRGSGILLKGAFGVEYESSTVPSLPPARTGDEGEEALTILNTGPDSNGDIEIAARDSDGDRIELSASQLFNEGSAAVTGQRLFTLATEEIERQLLVLDLYREIGDNSSRLREGLWDAANDALQDYVFGPADPNVLGRSYPSTGSQRNRDEDAVEILQDVVTALSSPGRFEDALRDEGVFEGVLGSESRLDRYDFNEIYDALEFHVEARFGYTDYTRFGAWTKSAQDYAVSSNRQSQPSSEDPDVFAYSPLEQSIYRVNDPHFPRNSRAVYVGQTQAVHSRSDYPLFYDGTIAVTVDWGDYPSGSSVFAVIRDLVNSANGDPFVYNGFDVEEIVFSGMSTRTDPDHKVWFSSLSPTVRIRYYDISRRESGFFGSKSHEGKFVGLRVDGPVGVIGTWELGDVKGAYGADFIP